MDAVLSGADAGASPREGLGRFFSAVLAFVDAKGLRTDVTARVSPATRAMMVKPPRALSFMPSSAIDEVEQAIGELRGSELLVEMGLVVAMQLGGTMILPVLRMAFSLFGQTPAAGFAHLDRFFALVTRGIAFSYEPRGEHEGMVSARFSGESIPDAAYHVLRGTLLYVFEIAGRAGKVDPHELVETSPAGTTVRYAVRW
jgi:hypothetical protein